MAQEIYDEIVAAGAPALPETHFYRVKPTYMNGYVKVEVRERRIWPLWSKVRGSSVTTEWCDGESEARSLARGAERAHREAFRPVPFRRFFGDQPW